MLTEVNQMLPDQSPVRTDSRPIVSARGRCACEMLAATSTIRALACSFCIVWRLALWLENEMTICFSIRCFSQSGQDIRFLNVEYLVYVSVALFLFIGFIFG